VAIALSQSAEYGTDYGVTSIDITFPSAPANGDLIILAAGYNQASLTPSSTGFSILASDSYNGTYLEEVILYKFAGASEPSTFTISVSGGTADAFNGAGMCWSGVDTTTPFDGVTPVFVKIWSDIQGGTITTNTNGAVHVQTGVTGDALTPITPGGWTVAHAGSERCRSVYKTVATAGSSTGAIFGSDNETVGVSYALKPAGGGGGAAFVRPSITVPRVAVHRSSRW
jgi:hypothetical protein